MSRRDSGPCLDEKTVLAFVADALDLLQLDVVDVHLARCASCRSVVADAAYGTSSGKRAASSASGLVSAPFIEGIEMKGVLGRGASSTVFAAWHESLSIPVAVKLLSGTEVHEGELERALNEARLMARLDHPNLLRVFGAGHSGELPYIIFEYMDGGTLDQPSALGADETADVARQLLSGVQALHDARILHRDIKPANCLRRKQDGRLKLADLGLAVEQAALEGARGFAGTVPFMAPELLRSNPGYSVRSDLYALGMTLLWIMNGQSPIPKGVALGSWIRFGERPRAEQLKPELAPALASLIDRLIAVEPTVRPSSAAEALAALDAPLAPARRSSWEWPAQNRSVGLGRPNWRSQVRLDRPRGHSCQYGCSRSARVYHAWGWPFSWWRIDPEARRACISLGDPRRDDLTRLGPT